MTGYLAAPSLHPKCSDVQSPTAISQALGSALSTSHKALEETSSSGPSCLPPVLAGWSFKHATLGTGGGLLADHLKELLCVSPGPPTFQSPPASRIPWQAPLSICGTPRRGRPPWVSPAHWALSPSPSQGLWGPLHCLSHTIPCPLPSQNVQGTHACVCWGRV